MPIYEYYCDRCHKTHSRVQSMTEPHKSECCENQARRVWNATQHTDVYTGRYEPALRRYVGTKTERRRLMKEANLIDYPYDN